MFRRLLALIPPLCSAAACVILAAWVASRWATDRWIITQLMFWVPSPAYLLPAMGLAVIGMRPWSRGGPPAPTRHRRLARVAALAAAGGIGAMLAVEWRLVRAPSMPVEAPSAVSLRLVHWNLTAVDRSFRPEMLRELGSPWPEGADVMFLSTLLDPVRLKQAVENLGPGQQMTRRGNFAIVSRLKVNDLQIDSLGIPSPQDLASEALSGSASPGANGLYGVRVIQKIYNRAARAAGVGGRALDKPDPGALLRMTLDTTVSLGRPLTVWYIDLPSSPLAPRFVLAKAAAERIQKLLADGAAPPDVMLGDFNIPHGSASLRVVANAAGANLSAACEQASWGPVASWPRWRPLWLIDHLFSAPGLAVTRYELVDTGAGEHRAQRATISRSAP